MTRRLTIVFCLASLAASAVLADEDSGNTYKGVESEMDRGTGRIVDQQTWELDRIDRQHIDQRPFEALEEERDREERIENVRQREILRGRIDALMRTDEPTELRDLQRPQRLKMPMLLDLPLIRWIIETSEAISASTQPATASPAQ